MNQEKLALKLKEIRQKNNLTQAEFAKRLNVTFQAVSKWENGKSIPDIDTLSAISKEFNINMDDLFGNPKKNHKVTFIIILISIVILIFALIAFAIFNSKDTFEFKTISTTCEQFTLSGSAAYSKDKTSIYISNIDYCGEKNDTIYESIECSLYEKKDNNISLVSKSKTKENISLEDFLKNLKLNVDNYNSLCKKITASDMYLEIKATDKNNQVTEYNIPLEFNDNCE